MKKGWIFKCFFLSLLFQSFTFSAWGQLNESDTAKFQIRAGLTGALQKGNVDLLIFRTKLDLVTNSTKSLVYKSQNNGLYQEFSGFKTDNDINSRNYLYFKPFRKAYPFAMIYIQTNFRRKIKNRVFGGAGYTFQVIQHPKTNLKLSGSMVYENTLFRGNQFNESFYDGSNSISLWRGTIYLAGWHKLFDQKLRLYYSAYWQPGLEKVPNNRTAIEVGFDFPVWKGISATVQYGYSFEQIVSSDVLQKDRMLTFGFSYQHRKN